MKHFLLILLVAFCCIPVNAQEYLPFCQENKIWHYSRNYPPQYAHTYKIHMTGDTIISGYNCKKIYNIGEAYQSDDNEKPTYRFSVFEEDRKIYVFYPNNTVPSLLYDFSQKDVGDVFSVNDMSFIVNKIETFLIRGRQFDITYLSTNYDNAELKEETVWISGIGSVLEDIAKIVPMWSNYGLLDSVSVNGETIWSSQIFGDAVTSIHIEKQYPLSCSDAVYDLQGRRVQTPQRGGLYIKNGRKFVQR